MTNLLSGAGNYEERRARKADDRFEDAIVQRVLAARGFDNRYIVSMRTRAKTETDTDGFTCKWLNEECATIDWQLEARRRVDFEPRLFLRNPRRSKLWILYEELSDGLEEQSVLLVFKTTLFAETAMYRVFCSSSEHKCPGAAITISMDNEFEEDDRVVIRKLADFLKRYES